MEINMKSKKSKTTSFQAQLNHWSKEVRERDGNRCVICGKEKYVQAHHILPKRFFRKFALEIDNGISLCPAHHCFGKFSAHMNSIWFSEWLKNNRPEQFEKALERLNE